MRRDSTYRGTLENDSSTGLSHDEQVGGKSSVTFGCSPRPPTFVLRVERVAEVAGGTGCRGPLWISSSGERVATTSPRNPTKSRLERLNGGLFVDAEYGGMTGRVRVELDDVSRLGVEVGVVGRHLARQPARPQVCLPPDALYDVLVHGEVGIEAAERLVRRPVGRRAAAGRVACGGQHAGAQPHRQLPPRPAW